MKYNTKEILHVTLLIIALSKVYGSILSNKSKVTQEPWIYKTIDNYPIFLAPFTGLMVGAVIGGGQSVQQVAPGYKGYLYGSLIGSTIGFLDEAIIALGYFDTHHLIPGVLGIGVTSKLSLPYYASEFVGFTTGTLISFNILDTIKHYMVGPIQGMLNGAVFNGIPGAVIGAIAGTIDEVLVAYNLTDIRYLSTTLLVTTEAKVISPFVFNIVENIPIVGRLVPKEIKTTLILCLIFPENKAIEKKDKVTPWVIKDQFEETLLKIVNSTKLNTILKRQIMSVIGTEIVFAQFKISCAYYFQNFQNSMHAYKQINDETQKNYYKSYRAIILFLFPDVIRMTTSGLLNNYQTTILKFTVQNNLKKKYLTGETTLKLKTNTATETITNQMDENIIGVTTKGSDLLESAISSYIGSAFDTCFLMSNNALDIFILLKIYNGITDGITVYLNHGQLALTKAAKNLENKINTLQKEINQNAHLLLAGDFQKYVGKKQQLYTNELRNTQLTIDINNLLIRGWDTGKFYLDFTTRYAIVIRKVHRGEIPFEQFMAISAAGRALIQLYSWYSSNTQNILELKRTTEAINYLMCNITDNSVDKHNTISYDVEINSFNGIIIEDFRVGYSDIILIDQLSIQINAGVYAITGKSGSGKSSFLSKIKGIQHNGLWAQGHITYLTPNHSSPVIYQVTQDDYIAPYSTLFELIVCKNRLVFSEDPDLEETITKLLEEIHIDYQENSGVVEELNTEKDWGSTLSGGQKKKIAIIRTIIRQPNIAIMDEIFNGLDHESIKNVQRMIKHYLPDTLFLIVDHNVEQNNYNNFYTQAIHLENQTLLMQSFE